MYRKCCSNFVFNVDLFLYFLRHPDQISLIVSQMSGTRLQNLYKVIHNFYTKSNKNTFYTNLFLRFGRKKFRSLILFFIFNFIFLFDFVCSQVLVGDDGEGNKQAGNSNETAR